MDYLLRFIRFEEIEPTISSYFVNIVQNIFNYKPHLLMEALGESDIEGIVQKLGDYSISGLIVKLIQFKYKKSEEMEKYEKLEMPRERIFLSTLMSICLWENQSTRFSSFERFFTKGRRLLPVII